VVAAGVAVAVVVAGNVRLLAGGALG